MSGLTSKSDSIKVRNEENVKETTNAHISKTRQDIKISSTYLESAANFTSDRCCFVIFKKNLKAANLS